MFNEFLLTSTRFATSCSHLHKATEIFTVSLHSQRKLCFLKEKYAAVISTDEISKSFFTKSFKADLYEFFFCLPCSQPEIKILLNLDKRYLFHSKIFAECKSVLSYNPRKIPFQLMFIAIHCQNKLQKNNSRMFYSHLEMLISYQLLCTLFLSPYPRDNIRLIIGYSRGILFCVVPELHSGEIAISTGNFWSFLFEWNRKRFIQQLSHDRLWSRNFNYIVIIDT